MDLNGRTLLKRQPKSYSALVSVLGYGFLMMIAFVVAMMNRGASPTVAPDISKESKKVVLRNQNARFSIARFAGSLPDASLVIGVYQSDNGAFFHQFRSLSESYANFSDIHFAMVNINIPEEMSAFENMRVKQFYDNLSLDDVPMVMFFYQNKEVKNFRLSLRFTNLGDQEIKKRIDRLINFSIKAQP